MTNQIATKADVRDLKAELKTDIGDLRASIKVMDGKIYAVLAVVVLSAIELFWPHWAFPEQARSASLLHRKTSAIRL